MWCFPAGRKNWGAAVDKESASATALIQGVIYFANFERITGANRHVRRIRIAAVTCVGDRVRCVALNFAVIKTARIANITGPTQNVSYPLVTCPVSSGDGYVKVRAIAGFRSREKCVRLIHVPCVCSVSTSPSSKRHVIANVYERECRINSPVSTDDVIVK